MGRPSKPFSIFRRKGSSIWFLQYRDAEGKRHCITTGQTDDIKAYDFAKAFLEDLAKEPERKAKAEEEARQSVTLAHWLGDLHVFWHSRYYGAKTARGYKISRANVDDHFGVTTNHILPTWGPVQVKHLTTKTIDSWILQAYADGHYSGATINKWLFALRLILDFAVTDGILSANPARGVKPVKIDNRERGSLTSEEVERLIAPANWNREDVLQRTAVSVAVLSGIRLGELRGLRWESVKADHLVIKEGWGRDNKPNNWTKNGQTRVTAIGPSVVQLLENLAEFYRMRCAPRDLVFPSMADPTKPPAPDRFGKWLRAALCRIGIDEAEQKERNLVWHSLRHTSVSLNIEAGTDEAKLRKAVGHADKRTMDRYSHLRPGAFTETLAFQARLLPIIPKVETEQGKESFGECKIG